MTPAGNWQELLAEAEARLAAANVDEARSKVRWAASMLLDCGLLDVVRRAAAVPAPELRARFAAVVARLLRHEPVQYAVGAADFMGLRIRCDSRALIPRPETELLVGAAEEYLREQGGALTVVDAGTGSGCIACALAVRWPRARILATDVSPAALELARENAAALQARVEFIQGDLLEPIEDTSVDLVVANPPYVSTLEWARLPRTVRDFEPRLALDGGPDGLGVISRLVAAAARVLKCQGRLMLEIGNDQADAVQELLCPTTHFSLNSLRCDFARWPRVVTAART